MSTTLFNAEFKNACEKQGCPLCRLRRDHGHRYLGYFLHEYVNDGTIADKLQQSMGFCHKHAWQLQKQEWSGSKDGLGVAITYERLLDVFEQQLKELENPLVGLQHTVTSLFSRHPSVGTEMADHLILKGECPACSIENEMEQYNLRELAFSLQQAEEPTLWRSLEEAADGFCRGHLMRLLYHFTSADAARRLIRVELARIAALRGAANEYVRKHDYRFKSEGYSEEERQSWVRAVALLVGEDETALA